MMDEPAHVGCLLDVPIIGVIEAVQIEDSRRTVNNRLVGVSTHSYAHEKVTRAWTACEISNHPAENAV
jgi:hypothetical protein